MKNKKPHYAWIILLGVILIRGFAGGGINSVSGLFLYPVSRDIGVGIGTLSIYLSITSIVMVLWLPLAGRLINRYDVRLVAAAGAVLQALSFMSFGLMNSVYGWYLMAVPYAMGSTILVSLLGPILINRWFAGNTGMMLGLQMAFVGLFGSVFQPAASKIISVHGWRAGYLFVGGVTLTAVLLSSVLFLRNRPEDKSTSPYRTGTQADRSAGRKESDLVEIPEKMALHSASFYLLLFFMISITGIGVFTQHIPTYGSITRLHHSRDRQCPCIRFHRERGRFNRNWSNQRQNRQPEDVLRRSWNRFFGNGRLPAQRAAVSSSFACPPFARD